MSNEYKDWIADKKADAEWWISRYPFLEIKCNDIYPWFEVGSRYNHWLTELPQGWIDAFGAQMCDELLEALGKYANDWIICQVKEKYSRLVIYYGWADRDWREEELEEINEIAYKIEDILMKYDEISYHTCVKCGAPATVHSSGWVLPYCERCFNERQMKCKF